MSMRIDMTWHDDEAITFQASCADCEYTSHPFEDEEAEIEVERTNMATALSAVQGARGLFDAVDRGEIVGLLGPNGSGKSTTLKIILGLVSPTRGRTEIFGRDSRLVESREAVGFLPENPYFYKYLTGAETLRGAGA